MGHKGSKPKEGSERGWQSSRAFPRGPGGRHIIQEGPSSFPGGFRVIGRAERVGVCHRHPLPGARLNNPSEGKKRKGLQSPPSWPEMSICATSIC